MGWGISDARARTARQHASLLSKDSRVTAKQAATTVFEPLTRPTPTTSISCERDTQEEAEREAVEEEEVEEVDRSTFPLEAAQAQPNQTMEMEFGRLKHQTRQQAIKIQTLSKGNSSLKQTLEIKKEMIARQDKDFLRLEEELADCKKAREDGREQLANERKQYALQISELGKQKELDLSLKEANAAKEAISDQCHTRMRQIEELQLSLDKEIRARESIEQALQELKRKRKDREAEITQFIQTAQRKVQELEAKNDELNIRGNRLVKQIATRRTYIPAEDETQVSKAFRSLHVEIRNWCVGVVEVLPKGHEMEFRRFPLASRDIRMSFYTNEAPFLMAYVWEWLLKCVFDFDQQYATEHGTSRVCDLWTDEESARHLQSLERQIRLLQSR
ncbi:hypothetical protein H2198_007303 [Neophaeococcomyces mojaviensis]|uniref:Uncharacterized protein n=1 Tax=Neophaeococcomyces mojaviensis TaxID=3383035 RepID=A0ACC3A0K1_9EURO|nr:hypothetical protein H2198_007303 [Knufia sp. JES_112]